MRSHPSRAGGAPLRRLSLLVLSTAVALAWPTAAGAQLLLGPYADLQLDLTTSYDGDLLVRVTNDGPYPTGGSALVDLPAGLRTPVLPVGCTARQGGVTCTTTQELRPGSYTTFPITPVQTVRGAQTVTARVDGPLDDPVAGNDRDSVDIDRLPTPPVDGDAVEAAVAVARLRFPGPRSADRVVLARADDFADALAGSPLTGDAPLLYTGRDVLDPRTAAEVVRVLAPGGTVQVLGGPHAVGAAVVDALAATGHHVTRLAGRNRIATALAVADAVLADGGAQGQLILARAFGEGSAAWADSVAVGGYAAATGTPVLLTGPDLDPAVLAFADAVGSARAIVLGGGAALPLDIGAALAGPIRIAGTDRAGTAAAIARLYDPDDDPRGYHLVDGYADDGWVYGLLAAGLAADEEAPVLYVGADFVPEATAEAVGSCRRRPIELAVVAPTGRIAQPVIDALDALDAERC